MKEQRSLQDVLASLESDDDEALVLAWKAAKPLLGALNWTSRWYQPRSSETQANKKKLAQSIADFVTAGLETKD